MSQRIVSGSGSARSLGGYCAESGARSVLVVSGKGAYARSGAEALIDEQLAGVPHRRFWQFDNNPKLVDAIQGRQLALDMGADLVVAVGGGSALDMAKLIAIFAVHDGELEDFVLGRRVLATPALPLMAIPTTCGTGSESTHFAVVYIDKTKYSLAHYSMKPWVAMLDPDLLQALPASVVAASGLDALSQAAESFWSVRSTEASRGFSRQAIQLLLPALHGAVHRPDGGDREALLKAANLAGQAIDIARTTAAHAASYPMTSHFGVPHGHAAALTLPGFLAFNAEVDDRDVQDDRGVDHVRAILDELIALFGAGDAEEAARRCTELISAVGLHCRLAPLGIDAEGIELIVANGFNPQRVKNNPRVVTEAALRRILHAIA